MPRPRIVLGDSSFAMLAFTESMLQPDFDILAATTDSETLMRAAQQFRPEMVLLDFSPSFGDALTVTRQLKQWMPHTKVVFFSTHDDAAYSLAAFDAGADGFLVKQRTTDLRSLLDQILRGARIQHPEQLRRFALAPLPADTGHGEGTAGA